MAPRLFVFGLGYSAAVLARGLLADGWSVAGVTRSADKAAALRTQGIDAATADELTAAALAGATHLLASAPPDERGDPALAQHRALLCGAGGLQWIGYLSTTGVYGDRGGGTVDETADRRPVSERGRRRVAAEDGWLALGETLGVPVQLFRLPGIYGPGRSALDDLRVGTARRILKPGHLFSRIHVADIAGALRASMARPRAGGAYNVVDDEPAPSADVIAYAAGLLGLEPPPLIPFEQAQLSPMAASFYAENKRVDGSRTRAELDWRPRYPTYREGLRAILEGRDG